MGEGVGEMNDTSGEVQNRTSLWQNVPLPPLMEQYIREGSQMHRDSGKMSHSVPPLMEWYIWGGLELLFSWPLEVCALPVLEQAEFSEHYFLVLRQTRTLRESCAFALGDKKRKPLRRKTRRTFTCVSWTMNGCQRTSLSTEMWTSASTEQFLRFAREDKCSLFCARYTQNPDLMRWTLWWMWWLCQASSCWCPGGVVTLVLPAKARPARWKKRTFPRKLHPVQRMARQCFNCVSCWLAALRKHRVLSCMVVVSWTRFCDHSYCTVRLWISFFHFQYAIVFLSNPLPR